MDLKQITHYNDNLKPLWGKAESVEWKNDGFDVQGWLLFLPDYDPAKKYPMIVICTAGHLRLSFRAGPGLCFGGVPFFSIGLLRADAQLPRQLRRRREIHPGQPQGDFGYGDLHDILAGVDTVTKKFSVDPEKID